MRLSTMITVLGALLALVACDRKPDLAAEEQKIRAITTQWEAAMAAKDVNASVEFYAPDGVMMPPGAPIVEGREALTAAWQDLYAKPGVDLKIETTKVTVAKSGDLAYEIGTYALAFDGDQGPVKDNGKYVLVWKKVDGNWKAAADIFNSNGPAK